MKTILLCLAVLCGSLAWETGVAQSPAGNRFVALDIYLESPEPVAAWQFEFSGAGGRVVGIENGESAAFDGAPYYDREAVRRGAADRVVVADFSLADPGRLPDGRTRIATLHLMVAAGDEPEPHLRLVTAVTHDGRAIDASVSYESRTGSEPAGSNPTGSKPTGSTQ